MAKKKQATAQEVSRFELPNGATIVKYDDGSVTFIPAPIVLTAADVKAILSDGEEADEDEEEDEEDGVSIEDMKEALLESGVTKKALKKMSDEEIEEAYSELESDEEDEEDEDEDSDEEDEDEEDSDEEDEDSDEDDEDEDEDEEVTPEALAEMDFEELEDLCDDKELETSADDFDEDDVEKLRKAIAKELGITLPKTGKKGKK